MPQSQQEAKIRIRRDEDPILLECPVENFGVFGRLYPVIPNVHRIMPGLPQTLCDQRREGVVHEKFHGTVSGSSRSRTASAA
jgi:hypothetical protein